MDIPLNVFLQLLPEKSILYFSRNYKDNPEPHYYILMKKEHSLLLFSCCTSQFETNFNFIQRRNLPHETLVYIKDDAAENPFKKDTYVNCNRPELLTFIEFEAIYKKGEVKHKGVLSDEYYDKIVKGILSSPMVETEKKDMFR